MDLRCRYCNALYFNAERSGNNKIFTNCCMRGKYVFDFSFDIPDLIKNLLIDGHGDSKHFRENIRQFNSALGFASFGASVYPGNVRNISGYGPYCFKVQGIIQHLTSNLTENDPSKIKYSQLYFVDSGLANQYRNDRNPSGSPSILENIDLLLRSINPYAKSFFTRVGKTRDGTLFWELECKY